jgi:hypothetical protein
VADDAVLPAISGDDQKIVLFGSVSADLAEGNVEAFGAGPRGLGQNLHQVPFAECEAAEPGDGRLLPEQFLDFRARADHACSPQGQTEEGRISEITDLGIVPESIATVSFT